MSWIMKPLHGVENWAAPAMVWWRDYVATHEGPRLCHMYGHRAPQFFEMGACIDPVNVPDTIPTSDHIALLLPPRASMATLQRLSRDWSVRLSLKPALTEAGLARLHAHYQNGGVLILEQDFTDLCQHVLGGYAYTTALRAANEQFVAERVLAWAQAWTCEHHMGLRVYGTGWDELAGHHFSGDPITHNETPQAAIFGLCKNPMFDAHALQWLQRGVPVAFVAGASSGALSNVTPAFADNAAMGLALEALCQLSNDERVELAHRINESHSFDTGCTRMLEHIHTRLLEELAAGVRYATGSAPP